MSSLQIHFDAIGICGPGLSGWKDSQAIFTGTLPYQQSATEIAASDYLPAAERRRVGTAVKLALAAAKDALSSGHHDASQLLSVFSSSGGDGDNCHIICEALTSSDRLLSPTRFTNSVHNAPSGYWGIALKARPASTSLCAFDGSFSAGLLEAATQANQANAPVLLIAYDTPYPEPLRATRPIAHSMGVALVVSPKPTNATLASITISLGKAVPTRMTDPGLEALRINVPAARCLPLLRAIAWKERHADLALDLFQNQQLLVKVDS